MHLKPITINNSIVLSEHNNNRGASPSAEWELNKDKRKKQITA